MELPERFIYGCHSNILTVAAVSHEFQCHLHRRLAITVVTVLGRSYMLLKVKFRHEDNCLLSTPGLPKLVVIAANPSLFWVVRNSCSKLSSATKIIVCFLPHPPVFVNYDFKEFVLIVPQYMTQQGQLLFLWRSFCCPWTFQHSNIAP